MIYRYDDCKLGVFIVLAGFDSDLCAMRTWKRSPSIYILILAQIDIDGLVLLKTFIGERFIRLVFTDTCF